MGEEEIEGNWMITLAEKFLGKLLGASGIWKIIIVPFH